MSPSRSLPFLFLWLWGCGPSDPSTSDGPGSDGGTTVTAGDTTLATADGTVGPQTTAASEGGTTGPDTGEDTGPVCGAPAEYFVPGCGDVSAGDVPIEAGCYVPCDDANPCASGQCLTAWVDPCWNSPCAACGGQQDLCLEGLPIGAECKSDAQCVSGVCWDFNAYDECCFGTTCSDVCASDQDCIDLAQSAGAPSPDGAFCGPDGLCDLVSTGLGSFACAGPMCG